MIARLRITYKLENTENFEGLETYTLDFICACTEKGIYVCIRLRKEGIFKSTTYCTALNIIEKHVFPNNTDKYQSFCITHVDPWI